VIRLRRGSLSAPQRVAPTFRAATPRVGSRAALQLGKVSLPMLVALALSTALAVWWLLDQPSPARLTNALEDGALPPLSELESELVGRRLRAELDAEAQSGRGDGAWDEERHARARLQARRLKGARAQQPF
jgi:hypothetical protein